MVRISLKNTFLALSFDEDEDEDRGLRRLGREGDASCRSFSADCAWPCRSNEDDPVDSPQGGGICRAASQLESLNRLLDAEMLSIDDLGVDPDIPAGVAPLPSGPCPLPPGLVVRPHAHSLCGVEVPSVASIPSAHSEDQNSCATYSGVSSTASDQVEACIWSGPIPAGPVPLNLQARQCPNTVGCWTPAKPGPLPKEYRHGHVPRNHNLEEEFKKSNQNEPPTTLMIRNIPNRYTQRELMVELEDLGFVGTFNFLYLPVDKGTMANVGYAFVNFVESIWAEKCMMAFQGYNFRRHRRHSRKVAAVSVAHIQGLEANLAHYAGAAVNAAKLKQRRPMVVANIARTLDVEGAYHRQLPPPR